MDLLTLEKVKGHWDLIKKRIRSRRDGVKIEAFLRCGYTVEGVGYRYGCPIVVLQSSSYFFFEAIAAYPDRHQKIEWAMSSELKQECTLVLLPPPNKTTTVSVPQQPVCTPLKDILADRDLRALLEDL